MDGKTNSRQNYILNYTQKSAISLVIVSVQTKTYNFLSIPTRRKIKEPFVGTKHKSNTLKRISFQLNHVSWPTETTLYIFGNL